MTPPAPSFFKARAAVDATSVPGVRGPAAQANQPRPRHRSEGQAEGPPPTQLRASKMPPRLNISMISFPKGIS